MFQINVLTQKAMEAVLSDFSDDQHLAFNSALLPLNGIGEDQFC
mgnify:CR=1 FL=1